MTKHCGLSELFTFLVAALFCFSLAATSSRADTFPPDVDDPSTLHILPDNCTDPTFGNVCHVLNGEINLILGEWDQSEYLNLQQTSGGANNLVSPVLLIFGVPVENLLADFPANDPFGGAANNPDLGAPNVLGATLLPSTNVGVGFNDPLASSLYTLGSATWPGNPPAFEQGDVFSSGDLYSFLGLVGNNSQHFNSWADADVAIPSQILGIPTALLTRPTGFNIWIYELNTSEFSGGETIRVEWENIPLGTFALAWGHNCGTAVNDGCVFTAPITETALLMPLFSCSPTDPGCTPPEVPEPTSLLLLGTGLLAVGRQWRKKQGRKQDVV